MSVNFVQDVKEFHEKFDLMQNEQPVHLSRRLLKERLDFLFEELEEYGRGCGFIINGFNRLTESPEWQCYSGRQDIFEQADGLVDLIYVAIGTLIMSGFPFEKLWKEVHKTNMAKVKGPKNRLGFPTKIKKPEGWEPPRVRDIIKKAGYDRSKQNVDYDREI